MENINWGGQGAQLFLSIQKQSLMITLKVKGIYKRK